MDNGRIMKELKELQEAAKQVHINLKNISSDKNFLNNRELLKQFRHTLWVTISDTGKAQFSDQ